MDIQSQLMELETAVRHVSDGLNAIEVMVIGMEDMKSQYAGGVYAVWKYLHEANQEVSRLLTAWLEAV